MTIANTILNQLGGNSFCAMTGAKNLGTSGRNLSMKCGGGKYVVVTLEADDTYTMETFKLTADCQRKNEKVAQDVYAENLRHAFTELTGLATSL